MNLKNTNYTICPPMIFGIGNPLIDILIKATDYDLQKLKMHKGTMELVNENRQLEILNYFEDIDPLYTPGGSAPNTIIASSGLGISSYITGKIGKDQFGDQYIKRINQYGVKTGIAQGSGRTGSSVILVTPDGERTMNTHLGMCQDFSINDLDIQTLSKSKILYFTGYMWDTDSQKSSIKKAISIAKENNVKIVFDVADPFVVQRNKKEFIQMIMNDIDIVFVNQSELKILFDNGNINESISELMKYINHGGIKLGKQGSLIFNNKERYKIQSQEINAIDTTGAGDMYAAGFLSSLAKGNDYHLSGKIAVHLAEQIIQIQGAQFEKNVINQLKSDYFDNQ